MKTSWLTGIIFLLLAPPLVRAQGAEVWNIKLAAGRRAHTTVGVRNYCQGAHDFVLSADPGMTWFSFTREPRLRVAEGETKQVEAEVDTTGLDVGSYEGAILVRCADCALQTCRARSITARLKVVWATDELERLRQDQFVLRQLVVVLQFASEAQIGPMIRAFEVKHQVKRLKIFALPSVGRIAVLFALLDPQDSVSLAVARLQDEAGVLYAQPNFKYETQATQSSGKHYNDPLAGLQYGARQMQAERLHRFSTGRGVTIALIDTGLDYTHTELKGRVIDRANFTEGGSFKEDVHGTLVAGVIAARPNNGFGIYGIAPGASLIAIKSFQPRRPDSVEADGSSQTLSQGLDYAISRNARVINLSIGGPRDPLISQLVRAAHARGMVLVAAAGNDGPGAQPKYPAALAQVLAVTAIDSRDELYWAANRGAYIGLAAPGVEIISTVPGDKFNTFSGTSMAAAHVSAFIALALQSNPRLTPSEIKSILENTARDLGPVGRDNDFGSGALDACRAFEHASGKKKACL